MAVNADQGKPHNPTRPAWEFHENLRSEGHPSHPIPL